MRDIHLRIHYGADDRFDVASKTIICSRNYFKTIRLVNLGPDVNSEKFVPLTKKIPGVSISNYGRFFHMCETEDTLRSNFMDVPDGDWAIWIDSDWRLPEYFLQNMQKEIETCEKEGINHIFSHQIQHQIVIAEKYDVYRDYNAAKLLYRFNAMRAHPESYGWPILQRVDKKNIYCASKLGNHPHMLHVPYNKKHIPEMYHLHFRDFRPGPYCGSSTFLCWWYMGHHVFKLEEQIEIQKSEEYRKLEAFKTKHKCFTSTQLHERIKANDTAFLAELKELFLTFKDTNLFSCKQMYQLANEYDMKFYKAPNEERCTGLCCVYEGKNIIDLADEFIKTL